MGINKEELMFKLTEEILFLNNILKHYKNFSFFTKLPLIKLLRTITIFIPIIYEV